MRTLKKTLCLVLCLAMMVGLCAFGASAEFTDADEIENKEAVDLLTGIGIIEGYTDGSFDPAKILTRAEACKIISYLLLGKTAAEALTKTAAFDDVPASHWAAGFISYCKSQGIVEGKGNNKFDPSGTLTAAAWGKMLLCALGYDQDIEGMTGKSWDFNVTRLVSKTKLADGTAFAGDTDMSRDSACLMAFNALTVPMVEYQNGVSVSTAEGTEVTVNATLAPTGEYLAEKYNLKVEVADANNNDFDKMGFEDGGANPAYYDGIVVGNAANKRLGEYTELNTGIAKKIETGADLLGHYVRIYVDTKGDPISISEIGSVLTLDEMIYKDQATYAATFGKTEVGANVVVALTGGADAGATQLITAGANAWTAYPGDYIYNDEGVLVAEVYADYAVTTLSYVKKIDTTAGAEAIEFNGINGGNALQNNATFDVVREYDGIAKGDIVVVSQMDEIYTIYKPETVEGSISKVGQTANKDLGDVTIDGQTYSPYDVYATMNKAGMAKDAGDPTALTAAQLKNNTYRLYLDADGNYLACEIVEAAATPTTVYFVTYKYDMLVTEGNTQTVDTFVEYVDGEGNIGTQLIAKGGTFAAGSAIAAPAGGAGASVAVNAAYKFESPAANEAALGIKKLTATTGAAIAANNKADAKAITGGATGAKLVKTDSKLTTAGADLYANADTAYVFVDETLGFGKTAVEVVKGGVNVDATAFAGYGAKVALYGWDADKNETAKAVFFTGAYTDAGLDAASVDPRTFTATSNGVLRIVIPIEAGEERGCFYRFGVE